MNYQTLKNYLLSADADEKIRPKALEVDGEFGPMTKARLIEELSKTGNTPTGICNNEVFVYLINQIPDIVLREGSTGNLVKALQAILNSIGEST